MDPDVWPLVGREDERRRATAGVAEGRGALLIGRAGVGGTRLARAVSDEAGRPAAWFAGGRHLADLPLGAFGSPAPDLRGALAALALPAGALVVVDDAHWLDRLSLALVEHLLAHTDVAVVLRARTGADGTPGVVELARRRGLSRVDVAPLTLAEQRELRRRVAPDLAEDDGRAAELVAAGRPRVLARALSGGAAAVPADDLDDELGDLTAEERVVLEMAAVADSIPVELAEGVDGGAALAALERRGILVLAEDGGGWAVGVADPALGASVRATAGPATRRLRCRQVLAHLATATSDGPLARVREASLRLELGDRSDPTLLLEGAAEMCAALAGDRPPGTTSLGDGLARAARLASTALDAGAGFPAAELLVRIEAHRMNGPGAAAALRRMGELATTEELRARVLALGAATDVLGGGDPDGLYRSLAPVVAGAEGRAARRLLGTVVVIAALGSGRTAAAVDVGQAVVDDPETTRVERLAVSGVLGVALAVAGRGRDGLALVDAAIAEARAGDDPASLAGLVGARLHCLTSEARFVEAAGLAEQSLAVAQALGHDVGVRQASLALAYIQMARGRVVDAAEAAERSLSFGTDASLGQRQAAAVRARARAHLEPVADAEAALADLRTTSTHFVYLGIEGVRAEAWVAAAQGQVSAARRILLEGADREEPARPAAAANALFDLVRLGYGDVADRLRALAQRCQDPAVAIHADHAAALHAGDGAALEAVAHRYAEIDALLWAAEAAGQAATAHDQGRRGTAAARAAHLSAGWAAGCQGARTPALRRSPSGIGVLTRREREVAGLAARGLGDREIGERLSLSVRTVESHLHRTYAKLSVSNRAELRDLLDLAATPPAPG